MKAKNKGIKRHESLYPLSHHHHHALFLALNLRKVGTDKSNHTLEELKEEVKIFWEKGQQHFRDEEEILLPRFAMYKSVDHPEIKEMLVEHVSIRAIINRILEKDGKQEEVMRELGLLLDQHIRREERVIFPMIEEALPEEALMEMAPYLHKD